MDWIKAKVGKVLMPAGPQLECFANSYVKWFGLKLVTQHIGWDDSSIEGIHSSRVVTFILMGAP